jgi:hypothetical protein
VLARMRQSGGLRRMRTIEDGGGDLKNVRAVTVRLPPTAFDRLRDDVTDTMKSATAIRIQGVMFKRGADGGRSRPSTRARRAT